MTPTVRGALEAAKIVKEAGGDVEFTLIDDERYAVRFSNGKL